MIITKIRIQEEHPMHNGLVSWPLPYCDLNVDSSAGDNGYILKAVAGIGPPDFTAVVDGFDINGKPVMDSIPEKREIALRIGFKPGLGQSVQELRSELYKYISRSVVVSFMNQSLITAHIHGFIQKFETVHFSNQPEIQITIKCRTGDFAAPESVNIPLALLDTSTPIISYYEGDAPTGMLLKFKYIALTPGVGFTISDYGTLWYEGEGIVNEFTLAYPLETDDEITLNTQYGARRLTLLRDGTTYDLAGYINAGAVWPRLYPGVNSFSWDLDTAWMEWISATYIPRYWGI